MQGMWVPLAPLFPPNHWIDHDFTGDILGMSWEFAGDMLTQPRTNQNLPGGGRVSRRLGFNSPC